ncbi:hypothetical protein JX265_010607 [Neoarthrinium moseri]|uniref:Uncharacterized protein n=1 Tax=Neoarthrinium moseri TaxID=1658444 RepID=A0A9P9WEC5_9PEZI|nr:uncharacterized protein JN550_011142 [Neoarthrinium moseri]KAI1846230.1 hypothetical protein JX266_007755 [Neoarthrinium moseri]KAI1859130.1 hypothetical protein JX265_010607 [Neoarthrinium moseri]KAI1860987.1 hypothetical protein JN550_011142 [Neoarthrinium moseri]
MLDSVFPPQDLSLLQRMIFIWVFIASGLVVTVQVSQSWADPRPRWTVVTPENKPYWYTYYTLVAFLFMQIAYGPLRWHLEGVLPWSLEVHVLDALWIGLLSLEACMLAYVFTLRISAALRRQEKVKEL